MTLDVDRTLSERYPEIFARRQDRTSPMGWGIACGPGWFTLLDVLCTCLQAETDSQGAPQVVASQVKEKFGELSFHVRGPLSPTQRDMISFAQALSLRTCEICGRPGGAINDDMRTRCHAHSA
jgi:hypothetical protein